MEFLPLPEELKAKVLKMACLMELADKFSDERAVVVKRINTILAENALHHPCLMMYMYHVLGGPACVDIDDGYLQFCALLWSPTLPDRFAKLYSLRYTLAEYEYVLAHLVKFYPSIHPPSRWTSPTSPASEDDDSDGETYVFPDAKYTEGRWL